MKLSTGSFIFMRRIISPGVGWLIPAICLYLVTNFVSMSWASEALPLREHGTFVYCFQGQLSSFTHGKAEPKVVIVDKQLQRTLIYLYSGSLKLAEEYPCGTGEKQGDKMQAGDERTPEGVYFITHRYVDNKVTIFGNQALHLDYPNAVDQDEGRRGNGIFIHGINRELRPRSSNGCITLDNGDLSCVSPDIIDQSTPVLVLARFVPPTPAEREEACQFLQRLRFENLHTGAPKMGHRLELLPSGGKYDKREMLENRLSAFDGDQAAPVRIDVLGAGLFRAGNQWVVVVNMEISGARGKKVRVTRRLYYSGASTAKLKFVSSKWIMDNAKSADMLASWLKEKPAVHTAAATQQAVPRIVEPKAETEIETMLSGWLDAWQNKRIKQYMRYYAADFKSDGMNKTAWKKRKIYLNKVYKKLSVKAKNVKIKVDGKTASVCFIQEYRSDWHHDVGMKELLLEKRDGKWQILREEWKPVEAVQEAANELTPTS